MRECKVFKLHFLFLSFIALVYLVNAQDDQEGFISLDCGLAENSSYSEKTTTINYISDAAFINSGVTKSILPKYRDGYQQQFISLRSFPDGIRNCYRISVKKGTKYLFRASFFYGNYDGLNNVPKFDLHIGPNLWDTVNIESASLPVIKDMIYTPPQDYVHVCLINTGSGTPFIQAIELRPLKNTTYIIQDSAALAYVARADLGSSTNSTYRYPKDAFDRIWVPYNDNAWKQLTTSLTVDSTTHIDYFPPSVIMNNAATPIDEDGSIDFYVEPPNRSASYYLYAHFAELQQLQTNESRAFDINVNGELLYGPVVPVYLSSTTIYSTKPLTGKLNYSFSITKRKNSTLPPILNAVEIYYLLDFSQSATHQDDVDAIMGIKSTYDVKKNWDGDPCVPLKYLWAGLKCTNTDILIPPRINSLDLSSSGLRGNISAYLSKLSLLESLDLSDNNLTGPVPDFLSSLPNLRVLNLERNQLTGSVPASLLERSKNGSLSVNFGENQDLLCDSSTPCVKNDKKNKKTNILIPIVATVGGVAILLIIVAAIFFAQKNRKKQTGRVTTRNIASPNVETGSIIEDSKKRQFTYSELSITNNLEKILGKGGFGTVYHGTIDDGTQVAVKMLSHLSVQGYQQFQAEVKLLMKVHHKNLTTLVGYCNEESNMALIYEYMANGSLDSLLSDVGNENVLSWEGRLQIAIDAAQGLEYLHSGCKPPIVHRDVKTSNILISANFHAKIADFGLSKKFPTDDHSYVSTKIAGTPGYLDPEYYKTSRLNEKSDVYSFGVVLLEIITGRPAIINRSHENRTHLKEWVSDMVTNGDINNIVDPKLRGHFEINSVWKAIEISMTCLAPSSSERPKMNQIVSELNECLSTELARRNNNRLTGSTSAMNEVYSMNVTSPSAR